MKEAIYIYIYIYYCQLVCNAVMRRLIRQTQDVDKSKLISVTTTSWKTLGNGHKRHASLFTCDETTNGVNNLCVCDPELQEMELIKPRLKLCISRL